MNYTIMDNPFKENSVILTRGVVTDAKVAKLNNDTKRPSLVKNWEAGIPQAPVTVNAEPIVRDYTSLLNSVGISMVNFAPSVTNSGAKKLRVNKIVKDKAQNVFGASEKIDIEPVVEKVESQPIVEEKDPLEPSVVNSQDLRGRHERTGEIPVAEIKEAVSNDNMAAFTTRSERNAEPVNKPEAKAGDIDLYNNLLHSVSQGDDVSHQLQGARDKLSAVKAQNQDLARKYAQAVKEYEALQQEIKEQQAQREKEELSITLSDIQRIEDENLAKTSDLTTLQEQIKLLKEQRAAMQSDIYENSRGMGRVA